MTISDSLEEYARSIWSQDGDVPHLIVAVECIAGSVPRIRLIDADRCHRAERLRAAKKGDKGATEPLWTLSDINDADTMLGYYRRGLRLRHLMANDDDDIYVHAIRTANMDFARMVDHKINAELERDHHAITHPFKAPCRLRDFKTERGMKQHIARCVWCKNPCPSCGHVGWMSASYMHDDGPHYKCRCGHAWVGVSA